MKGFAWFSNRSGNALSFVVGSAVGSVFAAIANKLIESNDLEWLKAIWRGAWDFVVGVYDWFFSGIAVPVWLIVPVAALALVPVLQLAKRVRIAATTAPTITLTRTESMVLGAIQDMDEIRKYTATLQSLTEHTTLSPLETATALDRLGSMKFISCSWPINGPSGYTVLPDGRAYLLDRVRART